jgi:hypothetical protein
MIMPFVELYLRGVKPEKRFHGRLLSLDPGQTTGYAVWECLSQSVVLLDAGQLYTWAKEDIDVRPLNAIISKYGPTHTVLESYQIYEWKNKDHSWSQVPTIQVIGGIKVLCQWNNITYSQQTAQVAKQFVTDEKLEAWGYYKPGVRHARDAIRHGCYYLLFRP